jgi:hypothetical protein
VSAEPLGRLLPTLPRWTTHEREGRRSTRVKPKVQAGMLLRPSVQAWCYLCGSEHRYGEPCLVRAGRKPVLVYPECDYCHGPILPETHRKSYCSALCRGEAKRQRRREARAAS